MVCISNTTSWYTLPVCKYKHYICKYLISNKEKHTNVTN